MIRPLIEQRPTRQIGRPSPEPGRPATLQECPRRAAVPDHAGHDAEVADMPRGDGRRVQFAAKAWTEDGRQFDLLLSDYQKRDWAVDSRWKVSARLKPVIGEVNLRGLNREAWALANGLDGAGTLGKGRSLVREGGGVGLIVWRDAVSRRWQAVEADSPAAPNFWRSSRRI